MELSKLRRADLAFGTFLIAGSLWYLVECVKLFLNPFRRGWEALPAEAFKETFTFWYKSPALLPAVVGALLLGCGILLVNRARADGARFDFLSADKLKALAVSAEFIAFVKTAGLLCAYAFVLIPLSRRFLGGVRAVRGFSFLVATFVYLMSMMLAFGRRDRRHALASLLVALVSSAAVTYAFGTLAKIPLP